MSKPKFKVGQVVCIRPSSFDRITHIREGAESWEYTVWFYYKSASSLWYPEKRLRRLTAREKGPK